MDSPISLTESHSHWCSLIVVCCLESSSPHPRHTEQCDFGSAAGTDTKVSPWQLLYAPTPSICSPAVGTRAHTPILTPELMWLRCSWASMQPAEKSLTSLQRGPALRRHPLVMKGQAHTKVSPAKRGVHLAPHQFMTQCLESRCNSFHVPASSVLALDWSMKGVGLSFRICNCCSSGAALTEFERIVFLRTIVCEPAVPLLPLFESNHDTNLGRFLVSARSPASAYDGVVLLFFFYKRGGGRSTATDPIPVAPVPVCTPYKWNMEPTLQST